MADQPYVDELTNTLSSTGWASILKPACTRLRDNGVRLLLMPGAQKELKNSEGKTSGVFTDDYLKGKIDTLNWFLMWDQRVEVLAKELSDMQQADNLPAEGIGTPYAPTAEEPTSPGAE